MTASLIPNSLLKFQAIDQVPDELRGVFSSLQANVFLSVEWFQLYERQLLPSNRSARYFILVTPLGLPLIGLPCQVRTDNHANISAIESLVNFYSCHYGLVGAGAHQNRENTRLLIRAICETEPHCSQLNLQPLNRQSQDYAWLHQALAEQKWRLEPYFHTANWSLCTQNLSFADYWQARPSRLSNTCRRKLARLHKNHHYRFRLYQQPDQALDQALDAYQRIYQQRWKKEEPYPDFIRCFTQLLAQQNLLRMGLLEIDAVPVAAQLWYLNGQTAYIFKLAHDPDFEQYSVGSLLTQFLLKQVIDTDGVNKVDFLLGDDAYKQDWMSTRGEFWGLAAYRPFSVASVLSGLRQRVKKLAGSHFYTGLKQRLRILFT
ncbi:MAG: ribosomal protein S18 acetylase RimI-like enzyme [Motiliproteus sp.]|jgi:ribosomal protein S18 acetylase RimI-like enzyme